MFETMQQTHPAWAPERPISGCFFPYSFLSPYLLGERQNASVLNEFLRVCGKIHTARIVAPVLGEDGRRGGGLCALVPRKEAQYLKSELGCDCFDNSCHILGFCNLETSNFSLGFLFVTLQSAAYTQRDFLTPHKHGGLKFTSGLLHRVRIRWPTRTVVRILLLTISVERERKFHFIKLYALFLLPFSRISTFKGPAKGPRGCTGRMPSN